MVKQVLSLSLFFLISGCATVYNPATEKREFIFIDAETEVSLGKNVSEQIVSQMALSNDAAMNRRVEAIGKRIAASSDRKDISYEFYCLADKDLNAVSLPGGFIFINSGLVEALNDDELSFVLSHEVGHLAAKHAIKKIQSSIAFNLISQVAFASTGNGSGSPQAIAGVSNSIYNLIFLGYSRNDEYESDKLGIKYSHKAGFDAKAAISALEKVSKGEDPGPGFLVYLRTHPYTNERIKLIKRDLPSLLKEKEPQK